MLNGRFLGDREMPNPFLWGSKGQKLTPEQVERERARAAAMLSSAGDTSPVQHWLQGAGRVANVLSGKIQDRRANASEELGMAGADEYVRNDPVLSALIGGSGGLSTTASTRSAPVSFGDIEPTGDALRDGIVSTAAAIGANPVDLATVISYETAGTFDPTKRGPTTQWGQHEGLIQFGEPQQQQYGYDRSDPLGSQLGPQGAIARYMLSSGFKPGMSGLDLYSTVNAGAPGRYGASDANNGGAPGDVRDKWEDQMGGHRERAAALLGGEFLPPVMSTSGGYGGDNSGVIAALSGAMSDPWVAKKYGPVINALMGQQIARGDMQFQQQLKQSDPMYQAQLAEMYAPDPVEAREPIEVGGVLLDPYTYQPIFDSRQQEEGFQMVPPEEVEALGLPPGAYQRGADGKLSQVGGGGVTTNIELGGGKFEEAFAKDDATALGTISASGIAATRNIGRINQLEELLKKSPSGLEALAKQRAGEWGIDTEGLSDIQAAQALINSLVPEQRQPGSGPMSDADLNLFKQSLPRIINQPGGNQQIIGTMRGIAQYDAAGAEIVQRLRAGEIDRATAFQELQNRPNPLADFVAPEAAGTPAGGTSSNMQSLSDLSRPLQPPEGINLQSWQNAPPAARKKLAQIWDTLSPEEKAAWQ